jgi:hypothetical protein
VVHVSLCRFTKSASFFSSVFSSSEFVYPNTNIHVTDSVNHHSLQSHHFKIIYKKIPTVFCCRFILGSSPSTVGWDRQARRGNMYWFCCLIWDQDPPYPPKLSQPNCPSFLPLALPALCMKLLVRLCSLAGVAKWI